MNQPSHVPLKEKREFQASHESLRAQAASIKNIVRRKSCENPTGPDVAKLFHYMNVYRENPTLELFDAINAELARTNYTTLRLTLTAKKPPVKKFKADPTSGRFYESGRWLQLRIRAFKKYGRQCMKCYATKVVMHVDHIKPRSKYPELALSFDNLQVLCEKCNVAKGDWDETDYRS